MDKSAVGRAVIIENKPGATERIAAEALKHAAPDGTTLLLAPIAVTVFGPLVFKDLGYDPAKNFAPLAQVATYEIAFAVDANHKGDSIAAESCDRLRSLRVAPRNRQILDTNMAHPA